MTTHPSARTQCSHIGMFPNASDPLEFNKLGTANSSHIKVKMQLFIVVIVAIIASVSAFAPRSVARPSRVLVSFFKSQNSSIGNHLDLDTYDALYISRERCVERIWE